LARLAISAVFCEFSLHLLRRDLNELTEAELAKK
jgi:hypothetical protein